MLSPELATELRSTRPAPSSELRRRVLEIAAREQPARPRRFSLPPLRGLALVAAPAVLAIALSGALIHGLVHSGSQAGKTSLAQRGGASGVEKAPIPTPGRPQLALPTHAAKGAPQDLRNAAV